MGIKGALAGDWDNVLTYFGIAYKKATYGSNVNTTVTVDDV
jgi:hypothetical protein